MSILLILGQTHSDPRMRGSEAEPCNVTANAIGCWVAGQLVRTPDSAAGKRAVCKANIPAHSHLVPRAGGGAHSDARKVCHWSRGCNMIRNGASADDANTASMIACQAICRGYDNASEPGGSR